MAILVYRVVVGLVSLLSCLGALREGFFEADKQFRDKFLLGGTGATAPQTFTDVTHATGCAWRCMARLSNCSYFFHSKADSACSLCSALHCRNITMKDSPGYKLFLKTEADPADFPPSNDTNLCPSSPKPLGCWKAVETNVAAKRMLSVGPAGVWGLKKHASGADSIYYRSGTYGNPQAAGSSWTKVGGHLIQLDVGQDVFLGINNGGLLWRREGIATSSPSGNDWFNPDSGYTWVSVSPATGSVWAVNTAGKLLYARDKAASLTSSTTWDVTATSMTRVDAGRAGVWALDTAGHLHCRLGTYGDPGDAGTEWVSVSNGTFLTVSSGTHMVVVVTSGGNVWLRTGLGVQTPAGLVWVHYPGAMGHVEVYESGNVSALWGLSSTGVNMYFSMLEI